MKFQSSPRRFALVAMTLSAIAALPAVGQTINEDFKLLPSDGAAGDRFGWSVAIGGTSGLVGVYAGSDNSGDRTGSAYLFDTITGQQIAKLASSDSAKGDVFGYSVAISGTTAVVGAWGNHDNGFESGSAYVFDTTTGQQIAKLLPNDGTEGDRFGASVAISGNTAVIGSAGDDCNGSGSGSAYLFDTTTGKQITKLLPNDGAESDLFGTSVAISGTTAVVGAYLDDDNGDRSGSAYLFDTTTGQQIAKLLPSDGAAGDEFGSSVSISDTTVIVGASKHNNNGIESGSAFAFDKITGQQIAKLLPDDGATLDLFGYSVAISGTTAVVGAFRHDSNGNGNDSGSAYIFDTTTGQQIAKLMPSDSFPFDLFGISVAINGTTAIVGSYLDDDNGSASGSAYVFSAGICFADLTGDGTLDSVDVSAFLTAYAASDPIADFNADGVFNFFDVSVFLTEYLAGCP